jgi:hypothetical protein
VSDKQAGWHILRWLKAGDFEKVFDKIQALKYDCGGVKSEIDKLTGLEEYIRKNMDGIVSYKDREQVAVPAGMEYRNLGTMERNVDIFARE